MWFDEVDVYIYGISLTFNYRSVRHYTSQSYVLRMRKAHTVCNLLYKSWIVYVWLGKIYHTNCCVSSNTIISVTACTELISLEFNQNFTSWNALVISQINLLANYVLCSDYFLIVGWLPKAILLRPPTENFHKYCYLLFATIRYNFVLKSTLQYHLLFRLHCVHC